MKNTLLRDILVAFILLVPYSTYSQTNDGHIEEGSQKLFARFEQRFGVLDSLIFLTPTPDIANGTNPYSTLSNDQFIVDSNSLIDKQVDAEIRAMKHQTGLSMTGQTYYRMDEGLALMQTMLYRVTKAKCKLNCVGMSLIVVCYIEKEKLMHWNYQVKWLE